MNRSDATALHRMDSSLHATCDDFRRFFLDQMSALYALSLLLTGAHDAAERCFMAALDECIRAQHVPIEKIQGRAKRAIIQYAIRLLKLHFGRFGPPTRAKAPRQGHDLSLFQMDWLLKLPDFDRVVFVMSVLENHSGAACAFLLYCSLEEVRDARGRALAAIGGSGDTASSARLEPTVSSDNVR